MKYLRLLVLSYFASASVINTQPVFAETMNVVTFSLPPLIGASKYSAEGLAVELLREILKVNSIEAKLEIVPRERANITFISGSAVVYLGTVDSLTDENFKEHIAEIPLFSIRNVVFYKKSKYPNFRFSNDSDLKKYSAGVLLGSTTEKIAIKRGLTIEPVAAMDGLFRKLYADRTDIVITTDLVGKTAIEANFPDNAGDFSYFDEKAFVHSRISIIVNNEISQSAETIAKIRNGLAVVYRNGTWLRLMEKYYGKDKTPTETIKLIDSFVNEHMSRGS